MCAVSVPGHQRGRHTSAGSLWLRAVSSALRALTRAGRGMTSSRLHIFSRPSRNWTCKNHQKESSLNSEEDPLVMCKSDSVVVVFVHHYHSVPGEHLQGSWRIVGAFVPSKERSLELEMIAKGLHCHSSRTDRVGRLINEAFVVSVDAKAKWAPSVHLRQSSFSPTMPNLMGGGSCSSMDVRPLHMEASPLRHLRAKVEKRRQQVQDRPPWVDQRHSGPHPPLPLTGPAQSRLPPLAL